MTGPGITLAFYKAPGGWLDRVIRWVTRSPYSHVEVIRWRGEQDAQGIPTADAFSSSFRDGGVRSRIIAMAPGHWDYLPVPWADPDRVSQAARTEDGARYDFLGLLLSQLFHLRREIGGRWFCSELVAHILDLPRPSSYSPGDLFDLVTRINTLTNRPRIGQI